MIIGEFDAERPIVRGFLSLPRISGRVQGIAFLLDTGSPVSIIQPQDFREWGIAAAAVRGQPVTSAGIGGLVQHVRTEGALQFVDAGREPGMPEALVTYRLVVHVAAPSEYNESFPSLLGMDFLGQFDVRLSLRTNTVELE